MRFEDLTDFQRELLTNAYRAQHTQRLRAWVGVPVCIAVSAIWAFIFLVWDDTGFGAALGWPVIGILGVVAAWMLFETLADRSIRWAMRGLGLGPAARRELLLSMRQAQSLSSQRLRARGEIAGELREGLRRAWWGDWWGTRR